jgi:hypothetical protein
MKYVVHDHGGIYRGIYIFPRFVKYTDFVTNMGWNNDSIVSAGFISPDFECYGKSVSLNKKSDPVGDTNLLDRSLEA